MCGFDPSLGECVRMPLACGRELDPVCGCDGVDYTNPCLAAMAGVAINFRGECDTGCVSNATCLADEYCEFERGCTGTGECVETPIRCPDVRDPVCGCDGRTYSNECEAAAARVNVASPGGCADGTCTEHEDCERGLYCQLEACTAPGRCTVLPGDCTPVEMPVCGCDGITYINECLAAAAMESISDDGACDGECVVNDDCARGEYCVKEGGCTGIGECGPRPEICGAIYDPVCGCDGRSYGNPCEANAAGTNVKSLGECPPED